MKYFFSDVVFRVFITFRKIQQSMKQIIIAFLLFATPFFSLAQETQPAWDNTVDKKWPELFVPVQIKSSADGKIQNAVFYKSTLS
ncbi:MAG: hypothetical protein EOM73_07240, partial [Bacteroidia bacterium]|nr:hypothetical protein [Bacteroidia bacterium]